MMVLFNTQEQ